MKCAGIFLVLIALLGAACERHDVSEVAAMEGHHARGVPGPDHSTKPTEELRESTSATVTKQGEGAKSVPAPKADEPPKYFPK